MNRQRKTLVAHRSRRLRFESCEQRLPLDGEGLETLPLFDADAFPGVSFSGAAGDGLTASFRVIAPTEFLLFDSSGLTLNGTDSGLLTLNGTSASIRNVIVSRVVGDGERSNSDTDASILPLGTEKLGPFIRPQELPRFSVASPGGSIAEAVEVVEVGEPISIAGFFVDSSAGADKVNPAPTRPAGPRTELASAQPPAPTATLGEATPAPVATRPTFDAESAGATTNPIARSWAFEVAAFEFVPQPSNQTGQTVEGEPASPSPRNTAPVGAQAAGAPLAAAAPQGVRAPKLAGAAADHGAAEQGAAVTPTPAAGLPAWDLALETGLGLVADPQHQRCGLAASTIALLAMERVRRRSDESPPPATGRGLNRNGADANG